MRVVLKSPSELLDSETASWRRLWAAEGPLASPFRSLDFALAAAPLRADTRVMLGRGADGAVDLILPLQISRTGLARPLGAPMCDVNGPLLGARVDGADLAAALREVGIAAFAFSGWPRLPAAGAREAGARDRLREGCAVADLSSGFGAWLEAQRHVYPKHFKKMRRLLRQAEREFGALDVRLGPAQPGELDMLIDWKRNQFARTGRHDILRPSWTRALLQRCARAQEADFSGVMATLRLGGRLAAAEFGLRSHGVLHGWIAGYDPVFASVSPGLILQERLLEEASRTGVRHAVLGVGETHYKLHYTSWMWPLDSGVLASAGITGRARALTGKAWSMVEANSPLARRARRRLDVILAAETRTVDQAHGVIEAACTAWRGARRHVKPGRDPAGRDQAGAAGHFERMVAASK
jgi:CelD/BcsL family acetyltransferase involved in cellulose biosynthesis